MSIRRKTRMSELSKLMIDQGRPLFFVMEAHLETMMERLNSIFRTILCILNNGLMKSGRAQWQKSGGNKKDFSIVLIHQDKKFFISELFKVIQDAVLLILHYRTMCYFRTISSSTFNTLDVQSVYTPSQIQD